MTLEERLMATSGKGPGFDQIRLAAAATVLMHHCRLTQHDIRDLLFSYSGGFVHFGLLAVIIFFAISGFLVTPGLVRSGNVIEYSINRALRIFPALIAVVIATMFCLGPALTSLSYLGYFSDPQLYLYSKNALTLTYSFLPGVTTPHGEPLVVNGALWTLHFEILSYGALALISILGAFRRRAIFLLIFVASYICYVFMTLEPSFMQQLPARFTTFMSLFIYFAAGSALFIFRDWIPFSWPLALTALVFALVALPIGFGSVVLPVCLPYITVFCGLSVLPGRLFVKRDISYGVYLIHAPIVVGFALLLQGVVNWLLLAMIVFITTAVLSYLCRTLVEEPALKQKNVFSNWINCKVVINIMGFFSKWRAV